MVERHGGVVEKFIGDAVVAVFGIPELHEDDALRAVRAAAEMRSRLDAIRPELGAVFRARIGVNTGEVVAGAGETFATGDPMNVAARLEAAEPDEILLGSQTFALVAAAVRAEAVEPLEPKGKAERVPAYRLIEVFPHAPAYTRRLDAPFVGRGRELGTLLGELARAEEAAPRRPRTQPSRRRRSPRPTTTTPTPLRSPSEHRFMLAEARAGRLGREAVATVPVKGGRLSALTLLALAVAAEAAGNRDEAVVAAKEAAEIVRLLGYAALEPRLRLSGVA